MNRVRLFWSIAVMIAAATPFWVQRSVTLSAGAPCAVLGSATSVGAGEEPAVTSTCRPVTDWIRSAARRILSRLTGSAPVTPAIRTRIALIVAVAAVLPAAAVSVLLLLIALVIDLVKRDEAVGTWQASHFSWRIRSVLWAGVLYLLTSWLWLLLLAPGWIAWSLISLWFLYRIVKGMIRMNDGRPMEPKDVI